MGGIQYTEHNVIVTSEMERLMKDPIKLAYIPNLRNPYSMSVSYFNSMNGFRDLNRTLPGFDLEKSMACSLESLFRLSPRAIMYEPTLFTELLPALHAPNTLVVALYIRTGRTEHLMNHEATHIITKKAARIAECAMRFEKERIVRRQTEGNLSPYERIVWMVATDSVYLKTWLNDEYSTQKTTVVDGGDHGGSGVLPPRSILSTKSRGAHTKPGGDPSTADFAEALLDWYLLGESDAVVGDHTGPSFGDTAAFRTVRPYYKVDQSKPQSCGFKEPVMRWDPAMP